MNEESQPVDAKSVWLSIPMKIGYGLTVAVGAFWVTWFIYVPVPHESCSTNWCVFWNLKPNEVGDTFAGLFGSLAFVWIVVTVLMQGIELREQRYVLTLQKKEMTDQRKATQDMARAMAAPAKIFEDEKRIRDELANQQTLDELIKSLRIQLVTGRLTWNAGADGSGGRILTNLYPFSPGRHGSVSDEDFFDSYFHSFSSSHNRILNLIDSGLVNTPPSSKSLEQISNTIEEILNLGELLSKAQKERVKRLKLERLSKQVELFLESKIWSLDPEKKET